MNNLIKSFKNNGIHLLAMVLIPVVMSIYPFINNPKNGAQVLITFIDSITPFIPEFIVPYILWYPFIIFSLIYFCFKDKKVYYRTLASLLIGGIISFGIFFVFQTYVPRPFINDKDIFSRLVVFIYSTDGPYNCFPSLHVLESYLMMKGVRALENRSKKTVVMIDIMAWIIIISTQFVKQHVIMDVVGGIYLAEVIFNAMPGLKRLAVTIYKSLRRSMEYS